MSTAAATSRIVTINGGGSTHRLNGEWTLCMAYVATTRPSTCAYVTCAKCTAKESK